jgi:hypothetical protein
MSVVASVGKAAGAEMLTGARPVRGRALPTAKKALVAITLLVLAAFATMIPASEAPNAEHYYYSVGTKDYQTATEPTTQPLSEAGAAPQMSEKEALEAYGKLPLSFVPNKGQTDEAVRHYAQGAGYGFFFTKGGAMLSFSDGEGRGHALGLDFLGANPNATLTAQKQLPGEVNYLVGDDPANWQQGLPTHAELLYGGLWPGIDMAVRGEGGNLKYEFHLKPGSSVEDIRLDYRGAEGLSVGAGGELLVGTSLGTLKDAAPVSYQLIGGERVGVESRYELTGDGGYGFAVGAYDPRYPLIIDPALDYSTFLGGTGSDAGAGIAVDRRGSAYVTGFTNSADLPDTPGAFPTTPGAFDRTLDGNSDAFVTKLNASGSALVYSTFLGGTGADDGEDIAVDASGSAYVVGDTFSGDFPTTQGAFDTTFNGGIVDAFVTKLNASGSALVYSTFLGGANQDEGNGIAVQEGRAYVTGNTQSTDFPTTPGSFDRTQNGSEDAYVTKLNASGSALDYSTLWGGAEQERGEGIAVDRRGRAYVTGLTDSTDFPTTRGAFDRTFNGGGRDAFVTKLNATGSRLAYSTYLGGTSGEGDDYGIAVRLGRAYVTGSTDSTDFPTTRGAFDRTQNGSEDAYVTKLNAAGSALVYSTFLGGTSFDQGIDIAVNARGRAYVTGDTGSANYPTTQGAFDTTFNGGAQDAFVTKLNASGSALAYSTFLGGTDSDGGAGIAVREGRAYVTGGTRSSDYPTTPGAFDTSYNGNSDAFVTKLPTG